MKKKIIIKMITIIKVIIKMMKMIINMIMKIYQMNHLQGNIILIYMNHFRKKVH